MFLFLLATDQSQDKEHLLKCFGSVTGFNDIQAVTSVPLKIQRNAQKLVSLISPCVLGRWGSQVWVSALSPPGLLQTSINTQTGRGCGSRWPARTEPFPLCTRGAGKNPGRVRLSFRSSQETGTKFQPGQAGTTCSHARPRPRTVTLSIAYGQFRVRHSTVQVFSLSFIGGFGVHVLGRQLPAVTAALGDSNCTRRGAAWRGGTPHTSSRADRGRVRRTRVAGAGAGAPRVSGAPARPLTLLDFGH